MKIKEAITFGSLALGVLTSGCKPDLPLMPQSAAVDQVLQQQVEDSVKVQVFYILPEGYDNPDNYDMRVDQINEFLIDAQDLFANEMERHGHGRKTFLLDWDRNGRVRVENLYGILDDYNDFGTVRDFDHKFNLNDEMHQHINILLSQEFPDPEAGLCAWGGHNWSINDHVHSSVQIGVGCLNLRNLAHELGHAFGLSHDFLSDEPDLLMNYGGGFRLSADMAEQLNDHPAFNNSLYPHVDFNYIYEFDSFKRKFEFDRARNQVSLSFEGSYADPYRQYFERYTMAYLEVREPNIWNFQPYELSFTNEIHQSFDNGRITYSMTFDVPKFPPIEGFRIFMKGKGTPEIPITFSDRHFIN